MGRRKLCVVCRKPTKKEDGITLLTDEFFRFLCPVCYKMPCWDIYRDRKQ